MSERIADEDMGGLAEWLRRRGDEVIAHDWIRARRVEQEQAEKLKRKDEVIKALADALTNSAPLFSVGAGPCWGCHSPVPPDDADHRDDCRQRRTALRLAGRLK